MRNLRLVFVEPFLKWAFDKQKLMMLLFFLATGDVGKVWEDGSFEVMGRFDAAEVRGCNLLVQ